MSKNKKQFKIYLIMILLTISIVGFFHLSKQVPPVQEQVKKSISYADILLK